ncbi:uncharacterized protein METZ01_LOCUS286739 [marine metagenome]|uniref:Uncharacterized protein n=1 Tax=marine metagenome TaxID=408172 RepID=A0A382LDC5_9ZZZZ
MNNPILLIIFFFITTFISSCTTSRLEEQVNLPLNLNEGESIAVISNSYHSGNQTEYDFIQCVNKSLSKKQDYFNLIQTEYFQNMLYPWLEPRTAPQTPEDLPEFLSRDLVRGTLETHNIKYLINISGETKTNSSSGALSCAAGPGGGGCFGLAWWDDTSSYSASVWDIAQQSSVGSVSATVSGTSVIPALIIPIPIIARTKSSACDGLVKQLLNFLSTS